MLPFERRDKESGRFLAFSARALQKFLAAPIGPSNRIFFLFFLFPQFEDNCSWGSILLTHCVLHQNYCIIVT